MLAGVGPDYYARLEQGRATNVSGQVLDAVAGALRLDELERRYLAALLRPARTAPAERPLRVRAALRSMISALDPTPAILHGPRLEVLAANRAARILIHDFDAMPSSERNMPQVTSGTVKARPAPAVLATYRSATRVEARPPPRRMRPI